MPSFSGLTSQEAARELAKWGPNEIKDVSTTNPVFLVLRQLKNNFVLYLLALAGFISFLIGEPVTAVVIFLDLFIIISVTFFQEYKAEKAISDLKKMLTRVSTAIRDGAETEIPSAELVPGDIIILRGGEQVPADGVLLDGSDLRVDESVLTGESKERKKTPAATGRTPKDTELLFMGTFVVSGRGVVKILHTGMNTRFGKITSLVSRAEKILPLQDKVNRITKVMVAVALIMSAATGLILFFQAADHTGQVVAHIVIVAIALSVSAFPEGLPVVLATALAIGATRMARKNAIVSRMSIIETLGETTVICTDKTGTLTKGEMTVKKIYADGRLYDVSGVGYEAAGNFSLDGREVETVNRPLTRLLECAVACNDARIERTGEDELYKAYGSTVESALLIMSAKKHVHAEDIHFKRSSEIPFNSERKQMSVIGLLNGRKFEFAKGAPEVIIRQCRYMETAGGPVSLTPKMKTAILKMNTNLTRETYHTLALAYRPDGRPRSFLGIVGIEDPPRAEVAEAINLCRSAGIAVKMTTGDSKETAVSIGRQVGIIGEVIEGEEMDKMTEDELSRVIKNVGIFARVRPEHKLLIVRLLKNMGEVVTMTGDGVNDAPALKEAHIGVAMGRKGTDVARSAADLILKDDNFSTIVSAVAEGRTIFSNIRKFVTYQLSCNTAELAILFCGVLLAPLLGWSAPLILALQILFMNLVTDDLPAMTLALNHSSRDVMEDPPRRKTEILNRELYTLFLLTGFAMALVTLLIYFVSFNLLGLGTAVSRTIALVSLIALEIINAFNFRSFRYPVLSRSPLVNPYLFYASAVSVLATGLILYTPLSQTFATKPLSLPHLILPVAGSVLFVAIYDKLKSVNKEKHYLDFFG